MVMHTLKPSPRATKKRIGRGGKRGKTSGRGHKGQKQHGSSLRPAMRDVIKKIPKLRGYSFNSIKEKPLVVNLAQLEMVFSSGDTVSPTTLNEHKFITKREAVKKTIKILGTGDLTKKLTCVGCTVSVTAKAKIEKAGGSVA